MQPEAQFQFAVETGVSFLAAPEKLRFPQNQWRIFDAKIDAVAIAQLRIVRTWSRRIAVKYPADGA